jgi:hypothetical protein
LDKLLLIVIVLAIPLVLVVTIAYGQSEMGMPPMPDNQLSNDGIPKKTLTLDNDDIAFHLIMTNGKMNSIYKLCAGVMGPNPTNFGCDQKQWTPEVDTGRDQLGHIWEVSISGDVGQDSFYGCVIGETEKKVSCNMTSVPTPPTEQQLIVDWSQSSAINLPATFRPYPSDEDTLKAEMQRQQQGQPGSDNNNNLEEEEEEDEND